jgi:hypothetical protein
LITPSVAFPAEVVPVGVIAVPGVTVVMPSPVGLTMVFVAVVLLPTTVVLVAVVLLPVITVLVIPVTAAAGVISVTGVCFTTSVTATTS